MGEVEESLLLELLLRVSDHPLVHPVRSEDSAPVGDAGDANAHHRIVEQRTIELGLDRQRLTADRPVPRVGIRHRLLPLGRILLAEGFRAGRPAEPREHGGETRTDTYRDFSL